MELSVEKYKELYLKFLKFSDDLCEFYFFNGEQTRKEQFDAENEELEIEHAPENWRLDPEGSDDEFDAADSDDVYSQASEGLNDPELQHMFQNQRRGSKAKKPKSDSDSTSSIESDSSVSDSDSDSDDGAIAAQLKNALKAKGGNLGVPKT